MFYQKLFKYKKVALLILLSINFFSCNTDQDKKDISKEDEIKSYLQKYVDGYKIPGLAVGIIQNNKIVSTFCFGVKNLNRQDSIDSKSIFHMASLSKPVTATAVMQLVEQGKIELDAPITSYLPYFKLKDSTYKHITIKDILTHTSGMPDVNDYEWENPQFDEAAAERYVRSLSDEDMIAGVGERWRYSNMAYDVLADVVSKVSGLSFEDYIKENLLIPLEMKNSSFIPIELDSNLRTKGHVWNFGTSVSDIYPYNRRHAPSSTLNSNIEDMSNWVLVNLNNGAFNNHDILTKINHDILVTPQYEINTNRSIGLSWFIEDYKGSRTISHEGSDLGYRSKLLMVPSDSIGIIIASNYSLTPVNDIAFNLLDILQGRKLEAIKIPIGVVLGNEIGESGIESAVLTYSRIKNSATIKKYDFSESQLNRLGYRLIRNNRFQEAVEIFKLNVEAYPNSANVYDSLAEAYIGNGQTDLAITFYKKTLQINPDNDNAKALLNKLKNQH